MADSPTIVIAHLDDSELKQAVQSLVSGVDAAVTGMANNFDAQITRMRESLKKLGADKIDFGGATKDSGTSKTRTAETKADTAAIEENTNAKKRNAQATKEQAMTYDQILGALQMAQRQEKVYAAKNPWSLTREESEKYAETIKRVAELQEKLNKKMAEMRYQSVAQYTPNIGAYSRSLSKPVGDTKEYKELVSHIKEMARTADRELRVALQNAFKMPANSIEEIRSKWAQLSALLKQTEGTNVFTPQQVSKAKEMEASLWQQLQVKKEISKTYDEEIQRMAQLIRQSEEYQKTRHFNFQSPYRIGTAGYADLTIGDETRKGALSIEEQLLRMRTRQSEELKRAVDTSQEINWQGQQQIQLVNQQVEAEHRAAREAKEKARAEAEAAQNAQNAASAMQQQTQAQQATTATQRPATKQPANFAEYTDLGDAIAHVLGLERKEVIMADELRDSQKRIAASLKQSKAAWEKLSEAMRSSENGQALKAQISSLESALNQLKKGAVSPMDLDKAFKMPEDTIARITEKMQTLISIKSRINFDDIKGQQHISDIANELDRLAEKSKKVQESSMSADRKLQKQMYAEYTKMPEGDISQIERKLTNLNYLKFILRRTPLLNESQIASVTAKVESLENKLKKLKSVAATKQNIDEVIGMSPKTLNEMAEKLARLQAIKRNIDTTKTGAAEEFRRIDQEIIKVNKEMQLYTSYMKQATKEVGALGRSWNYMKNRLAFYFTVGASTAFVKNLIEIRSQYEMTERALGILVQSAQRGSQIFNELSQMALVSPYTLIELSNAAKQLTAYGVAAKDVVDTTRRMGDMAAAVGIPMERLTYALGQIKAYGYLNSRDARMFLNAGIPLVQELANHYTKLEGRMVSVSDIYDRIKKKAVSYNDVMSVITEMTDESGRFFDFQAKMAGTLKVQLANLTLAWNNMLNDIGNSSQGLLTWGIGALKDMFIAWKQLDTVIRNFGITLILNRLILFTYLAGIQKLTAANALAIVTTKKFVHALRTLKAAFTSLSSHPIIAALTLITALLVQVGLEAWDASKAAEDLNKAISDGAKESVKSIDELTESYKRLDVAARAAAGTISEEEGKKYLDQIKEAIDLYSSASAANIREIFSGENDNERIQKGLEYLEKIKEVNQQFEELKYKFDFTTDWMWGAFGEGIEEDIEDYTESLERLNRLRSGNGSLWDNIVQGFTESGTGDIGDEKEAIEEIENFAKNAAAVIQANLGAEGILDPVKVREAVARLIKEFEAQNPKIRGAGKLLFESVVGEQMEKEFEIRGNKIFNSVDMAWNIVMEKVKKDAGSTFQDLSGSILDESKDIPVKYTDAIKNALLKLLASDEIPQKTKELLQKVKAQVDAGSAEIRNAIAQTFDVKEQNALQKDFVEHFIENGLNGKAGLLVDEQRKQNTIKYARFNQQDNEDFLAWEKRLQEALDKTRKEIIAREKALRETSPGDARYEEHKRQLAILREEEKTVLEVIRYEKMSEKEGKQKKNKSLDSALSEEVQLIGKIQKRYQENKKLGMSDIDARTKATDEYRKSLSAVNAVLRQYGLQTMSNDRLATMKPQEIREFYENQLHGISQTVQKIRTVTYDAAKEEMSEIDGISKKLVEQTKIFEGFRANSYYDKNNVLTIGYGHSAKAPTIDKNPIVEGMTLTEEEAHRIMMEDYRVLKSQADEQITKFQGTYDTLKDMTASQYEALLDFTYQYGAGNLRKLLEYAEGDKEKIAEALGDTTVFGVKNWAQETRRAWRQAMFSGKEYTVTGTIRSQFEELTKEGGKGIKSLEDGIAKMGDIVNKELYENIAKGLNNELGKLKDEYELGVELDANPELGNLFADIWGINMDELPKTVKEYAKRATTYLNRYLSGANQGLQFGEGELFNLTASDMRAFEQMVQNNQLSQSAYDEIKKAYEFIRDNRLKDTKETMAEWNKLLEKYSEYEYKLGQIQKTAVRERLTFAKKNGTQEQQQTAVQLVTQIDAETDAEKKQQLINQLKELVKEIAGKDGVKIQIVTAIDSKELEDSAQLSFEQFQKDPTWLTATGDLAGLTDSALGLLISRIEEYKKTAKNLTPKQIKQINNALKQLHQQVRKGNPFQVLSLAMKESKSRMDGYKTKIAELTEAEEDLYQQLEGESDSGKRTAISKQIQEVAEQVKKTKEEMEEVGETDFSAVLDFSNSLVQGASQVEGAFSSMFKAMGNTEFAETMDKVTNVLSQTASFAAAGFQMGGAWGAAIGGIIGLGTSLITNFAEQWSGNKGITEAIQESEKAVRSLEVAYKRLDVAINNAYGDQVIGAKRATVENKKLQLAELERQLQLEKSRKAKYRDDDKIISLQGQIIELKEEIANATKDIVNDLLGISSVGDAAENAVASMIEAFKNGEDYMKVFDESFEDMIDNMIVKAISAQVIGDRIQAVFDLVKQKSIERADNTMYEGIHNEGAGKGKTFREQIAGYEDVIQDATSKGLDSLADLYQSHLNELLDEYNEVARIRPDDIKNLQDAIDSLKENAQDEFLAYMEAFGISFGQDSENNLSNLQQGLQSVSESTASAVEAYLNGMSQQAYLRNDLLTQIRNYVADFDINAQTSIQAQMLLQLQQSYTVQMAIQGILEGWNNPSGQAVRVELVS